MAPCFFSVLPSGCTSLALARRHSLVPLAQVQASPLAVDGLSISVSFLAWLILATAAARFRRRRRRFASRACGAPTRTRSARASSPSDSRYHIETLVRLCFARVRPACVVRSRDACLFLGVLSRPPSSRTASLISHSCRGDTSSPASCRVLSRAAVARSPMPLSSSASSARRRRTF